MSWRNRRPILSQLHCFSPYNLDVSQTRDKRRRNDLDLFVLALVASGISTPYSLKVAADLSPGATIPVLSRLVKERLVTEGKAGARGRIDYKITARGKQLLKSGWNLLIQQGPIGDLDVDLRVALLALWIGGDRRSAAAFLEASAVRINGEVRRDETAHDLDTTATLASLYRGIRRSAAADVAKGKSKALIAMAAAMAVAPSLRPNAPKRAAKL